MIFLGNEWGRGRGPRGGKGKPKGQEVGKAEGRRAEQVKGGENKTHFILNLNYGKGLKKFFPFIFPKNL